LPAIFCEEEAEGAAVHFERGAGAAADADSGGVAVGLSEESIEERGDLERFEEDACDGVAEALAEGDAVAGLAHEEEFEGVGGDGGGDGGVVLAGAGGVDEEDLGLPVVDDEIGVWEGACGADIHAPAGEEFAEDLSG
jgi:hypothetical protein